MANFRQNFRPDDRKMKEIPEDIIEEINNKLAYGLKYSQTADGTYLLTPTTQEINIKLEDFRIKDLDKITQHIEKEKFTFADLVEYGYNSQTTIELIPQKEFKQYINGQQIENDAMILGRKKFDVRDGIFFIKPQTMNNSFELLIGTLKNKKKIKFKRASIDSLVKKRFVSTEKNGIKIEYIIDGRNLSFMIKPDFDTIYSVGELYDSVKYVNDVFEENSLYIGDTKLDLEKQNNETGIDDKSVEYIRKIYEIEKIINADFDVKKILEFNKEDQEAVAKLYSCLILKTPVRTYQKINYFSYEKNDINDELFNKVRKEIKKPIYLEHEITYNFEIFSVSLLIKGLCGFFNMMVDSINLEDDTYYVYMEDVKDKKMYNCMMLFLNDEDVSKFQDDDNHVNLLHDCQPISNFD